MKKRVLITMLALSLALVLIAGATMAWFTDSDESGVNSFTAGTLLIDIQNEELNMLTVNPDILNPGDEWEYDFDVVNVGSKNLIFTGLLTYNDILGKGRTDFPDGKAYGTKPLSEVLNMEISVVGQTAPFYNGTLAAFDNSVNPIGGYPKGLAQYANPILVFGEASLTPDGGNQSKLSYHVKLTLPKSTNNDYQGSQIELAFSVLAKQIHPDAEYGAYEDPFTAELVLDQFSPGLPRNDYNRANGLPYIDYSINGDELTVTFVNPKTYAYFWEYRIDGKPEGVNDEWTGTKIIKGDLVGRDFEKQLPGVLVINSSETKTFSAREKVEIILRRGAAQDYYIDWINFIAK